MIPVLAIVGKSKSGKTTLMVKLISEFRSRGLRVAAVKHAHQTVELDTEGKDTWQFARAGSSATAVSSPGRLTVFRDTLHEPTVEEVLAALGDDFELVLLEGFKKFRVPKIEVHNRDEEELFCQPDTLLAVITDRKLHHQLPQFGSSDIVPIADFIEEEILNRAQADISVFVNGRQVFIKSFVKDFISRTLLGMLSALKNVGIINTANISLRTGRGKQFTPKDE